MNSHQVTSERNCQPMPLSLDEQMQQLITAFGAEACESSLKRCLENTDKKPSVQVSMVEEEEKEEKVIENLNEITIEQERQLNRAILDSSFDAIIVSNPRGRIIKVNRAALRQFGYRQEGELIGKSVSTIVGGGEARYHDEYFEKYRRRGMHSPHFGVLREVVARRKNDRYGTWQYQIRRQVFVLWKSHLSYISISFLL